MKTPCSITLLILLSTISTASAQAPGSAGAVFLLIQPSLHANGAGGASVASVEDDALGRVDYRTFGASISSYGLLNAILQPTPQGPLLIRLLTEHLDVLYAYASYNFEEGHPLAGTDFHGVSVRIF